MGQEHKVTPANNGGGGGCPLGLLPKDNQYHVRSGKTYSVGLQTGVSPFH